MEIIRHGNTFRIATCLGCNCEFRFNKSEIKTGSQLDDAFGHYIEWDFIECPECGRAIILSERDIEI